MSVESGVFPSSLAILGGIPIKSQDYTASVIFALVYGVLVIGTVLRVAIRISRCWTLLRLLIFVNVRVATFAIRVIQANGHYSEGLFIGEQILLLCGFVLLCEPLVELLGYHITRRRPLTMLGIRTRTILHVLRIALLVALGMGAYASTQLSKVDKSSSVLNSVKALRDINAVICMVITALAAVVVVIYHFREGLPVPQTVYLFFTAIVLTIPSVYKLVLCVYQPPPDPIKTVTKFTFYLLNALPELTVCFLLLSINVNTAFDTNGSKRKGKESNDVYPIPDLYNSSVDNDEFGAVSSTEDHVMENQAFPVDEDEAQSPPPYAKPESRHTGHYRSYGRV